MANLLERAIDCDDGDDAAKVIRNALGIASDEVANYVFPKTWPANREQRARVIGEWLKAGRPKPPHLHLSRTRKLKCDGEPPGMGSCFFDPCESGHSALLVES
jgi:hypothetical protein